MKTIRVLLFSFVVLIFALVGGIALWVHADTNLRRAETNARDVRLKIKRVEQMAATIKQFQMSHGRLPTSKEVSCDFKPCEQYTIWVWRVIPESDGNFSLRHTSIGVPFSPVRRYHLTWYSRDGSTDYDNLVEAWQWRLWFLPKALIDVLIILAPWLVLAAIRTLKRRAVKT